MTFHPSIPADLISHVRSLFAEYDGDCADNLRIACITTGEGMAHYEKAQYYGCCGSVDEQIDWHDGLTYAYGWNYGH